MSLSCCLCHKDAGQAGWGGVGEVSLVGEKLCVCECGKWTAVWCPAPLCPWCSTINRVSVSTVTRVTYTVPRPPPCTSWHSRPHQGFFTFFTEDELDADSLRLRCNVTHKTITSGSGGEFPPLSTCLKVRRVFYQFTISRTCLQNCRANWP